jgi:molybdate transport system substrate-binding protein
MIAPHSSRPVARRFPALSARLAAWACALSGAAALAGCAAPPPLATTPVPAQARASLKILVTGAMARAFADLEPAAERQLGIDVAATFGAASGDLSDRIAAGEPFDAAILTPAVNSRFITSGNLRERTYPIVKVAVGIGIAGTTPPAISIATHEDLTRALTGAETVYYTDRGMGAATFHKINADLALEGRINVISRAGVRPEAAPGHYALLIAPLTEVRGSDWVDDLGQVPRDLQSPVIIEGAISAHTDQLQATERLLAYLQGEEAAAILDQYGFDRPDRP